MSTATAPIHDVFEPATRHKLRGRIALCGPAGSGKTFTALRIAFTLGQRIAVVNTESRAVHKYIGLAPDGIPWRFNCRDLSDYAPTAYTDLILAAARGHYDVLVIDSLSHAWQGQGGALELVDRKAAQSGNNTFTAWRDVTPMHWRLIEAMLGSPCHVIATMRTKMEYALETNEKGKLVPRKIGMAPIQRQGMEYEFDLVCDLDQTHTLTVTKTRCSAMDGVISVKPGAACFEPFKNWLEEGDDPPADYFIATEADLVKSEQARLAAEKELREAATGRNGPVAPAKADLAALRAKAAGQPATAIVTAAPVAAPSAPPPATAEALPDPALQKPVTAAAAKRITALFDQLAVPPDDRNAILRKRGVAVVKALTRGQAGELTWRLEDRLKQRQVIQEPPPDARPAATPPAIIQQAAPDPKATPFSVANTGQAGDTQLLRIESLIVQIAKTTPDIGNRVHRMLDKVRPGMKLADMSAESADKLIGKLTTMVGEAHFGNQGTTPAAPGAPSPN